MSISTLVVGGSEYTMHLYKEQHTPDIMTIQLNKPTGVQPEAARLVSKDGGWTVDHVKPEHTDDVANIVSWLTAGRPLADPKGVESTDKGVLVQCTCGLEQVIVAAPRHVRCPCGLWLRVSG